MVAELGTQPLPPAAVPESNDPFAGKRLTLYVKDADLADILRMIASQFNLNILATQDVKALITVRLNDVPLRTGLDALVKAASQFEVMNIISHEPSLEDIFMTYYNEGKNNVK